MMAHISMPWAIEQSLLAREEAIAVVTYYKRMGRLPEGISVRAWRVIENASYGSPYWIEYH